MNKTRIILAFIMLLSMQGCKDKIEPGTAKVERPVISGVATMETAIEKVPLYHETTATVTAEVESMVSSRIMGPVRSISVREGDRVAKGELLIIIDSDDIDSKVAAAEAAYREAVQALSAAEQSRTLAGTTYNRFKNLYTEKALSLQEFDKIETQKKMADIEYERVQEMVNRAKAGLAEAKVYKGFKEIASPINGIITAKFIDPGTMAMPGMQLLTVEDPTSYRLETDIDESLAGQITRGTPVEIVIRSLDTKVQGEVSEAVPAVNPRSRTFKVYISLPRITTLHSGLYARVKIPVGQQERIMVPETAIVTKGQLTGVYVVSPERIITYRLVRPGRKHDRNVEILSGIKPGETIISGSLAQVIDGAILEGNN